MGNINRELEILRKNKTEMQEIKNTATKMKNAFGGRISRLDTVEERTPELEDISIQTSKTERQRETKDWEKNWIECPGTLEQLQKYNIFQVFEIPEEKKEKKEQKKYLKK